MDPIYGLAFNNFKLTSQSYYTTYLAALQLLQQFSLSTAPLLRCD